MTYPPNPLSRTRGNRTKVESPSFSDWSNSTDPSLQPSGVVPGDYHRNQRILTKFRADLHVITDKLEHVRSRQGRVQEKVLHLEQILGVMHQELFPGLLNPYNSTDPDISLKSIGSEECGRHIITTAGLSSIVTLLLVGLFTVVFRLCSGGRKSAVSRDGGGRSGHKENPPRHITSSRFEEPHVRIEVSNQPILM